MKLLVKIETTKGDYLTTISGRCGRNRASITNAQWFAFRLFVNTLNSGELTCISTTTELDKIYLDGAPVPGDINEYYLTYHKGKFTGKVKRV
jgi:hypothetical protein